MTKFYDFKAVTLNGKEQALDAYKGKVVLVVNTASKCGLTPQYTGLQELYAEYHSQGLEILGFPCNQFGKQEPGNADQISEFCEINYGVEFPMFGKIDVNGKDTHPVFEYLKDELPGTLGKNIKWNFTKFLIGKDGQPIKRFAPTTKPADIKKHIEKALTA
ncbi:glutathione peroxidase [Marinicella sp. S1101]|uniref:glutathione peroxidase n=1 Tax=Marinicella marina TaxID=2996016 RepID=UPI002260917B|nr:glutathione peroxidase [Marinicella marina]MCX7553605.1 glutathione peroxidase [Marinicella marina]MDJ1140229.1 glutathione peroxidase [Marinicella marina]